MRTNSRIKKCLFCKRTLYPWRETTCSRCDGNLKCKKCYHFQNYNDNYFMCKNCHTFPLKLEPVIKKKKNGKYTDDYCFLCHELITLKEANEFTCDKCKKKSHCGRECECCLLDVCFECSVVLEKFSEQPTLCCFCEENCEDECTFPHGKNCNILF